MQFRELLLPASPAFPPTFRKAAPMRPPNGRTTISKVVSCRNSPAPISIFLEKQKLTVILSYATTRIGSKLFCHHVRPRSKPRPTVPHKKHCSASPRAAIMSKGTFCRKHLSSYSEFLEHPKYMPNTSCTVDAVLRAPAPRQPSILAAFRKAIPTAPSTNTATTAQIAFCRNVFSPFPHF